MHHRSSWITALLAIVLAVSYVHALHFYLDGADMRCFVEELPADSNVIGSFKSETWGEETQSYQENAAVGIQIFVEDLATRHAIVNQKAGHKGRFSFTTTESGEHHLCFSQNSTTWFNSIKTRLYVELMFGDPTHKLEDGKKDEKLNALTVRLREMNNRISNIRREQQYQRDREVEFRQLSEKVKGRVFYWTVVQLIVLGLTCAWQLTHLKKFFVSKKLV
ncbi:emp24/gp25L/p24 family/GOLD-domain-containing protein [Polychytrium aggregatum]|uniref:emp24/gp25L/p24 family/GOLD-domain-containing protein n=1 Tax=Polychytrium aggregatum TaxID=110093 RepID=UPI0022FE6745|nr:emp24/gp25L/p24 family/GOLD-domain-containing protein [Polychytrium aggregatum]KAI9202981.1 emp24/gp25L/p24 family/GOLD-domain-containing protein [Polychytrium aggregatum]